MPPKVKKTPPKAASTNNSSKPVSKPDKVEAKKESTHQAQNDESEKDKEIKLLRLRVEYLETHMDPKVFRNASGSISIGEEDMMGMLEGALKTAEEELVKLRKGEKASGDGDFPGNTVILMGLNEKIDTMQKEISNKNIEIANIKTELNKAKSALDEMPKQLSDNKTTLNNLNKIITERDTKIQDLQSKNDRLSRGIPDVLSKRHSTKQSPRNTSPKSDSQSNAKLQEEIRKKDQALEQLNKELKIREKAEENLKHELQKAQSERDDLQKKHTETSKETEDNIKDLQSQLASLRTELQRKEEMSRVQDKNNKPEITSTTNTNLQEQLKEKESKIKGLESHLHVASVRDPTQQEITRLANELGSLKDKSAQDIAQLKAELKTAKEDLEIKKKELLSLQDKKKAIDESMTKQINEKDTEIEKKTSEIDELKKEIADLKKKSHNAVLQLDTKERETKTLKEDYQKKIDQKDETINSLRREKTMDKTVPPGRDDVGSLKQQLSTANQEIEELKSRLSKMVGDNLTSNNPNITDLSDENRPTKLAEMYSEIYDNEWTDAFEELKKREENETVVIAELLKILQDTVKFCGNVADRYIESLQKSASRLQEKSSTKNQFKKMHLLKELRKNYAPSLAGDVFSLYVEEKKLTVGKTPKVEAYTKSCIRLCWLMSVQDPQVVLDAVKTPTPFDANRYRTYTKSGKTMEYVVWPTMLLNEGGPILIKGVAQCK